MPLQKLIFKPGINKEGTDYSNQGGWFDSNLMRFRKGLPEKIGGWAKNTDNTFLSTCRALHAWVDQQLTSYLGIGTTWKYYVKQGDSFNDITPIRATTTNGVVFAATDGSSIITATDSSHGAQENDFVTLAGAVSLGGVVTAAVLNQEYQIASVPSVNTYTFVAKDTAGDTVTANSSDTGNGGSGVDGAYQINVGIDVYVQGSGWGAGTWGAGTFGSVSGLSASSQLRLWSHDNFGEDLVMNVRGGGVYYWDESGGASVRAIDISELAGASQTPTVALQVLVSDIDRHIICFGADPINSSNNRTSASDPMFICWSDQENATEWEPRNTNTAGSFRLSSGSGIVGAIRARQETLVWTDTAMYSMQFIGQPFTFGITLINEGVGMISPNAAINSPSGVFWMDKTGFYKYSGSISELACSVQNYVLSDLNTEQTYQIFCALNKEFDEVSWFYCSSNSDVPNKYVTYNYLEQYWAIGEINRTAWIDQGVFNSPLATYTTSDVGYLYDHETGNNADGDPMDNVFIESSDFEIGDGETFQMIKRIIPDVKFTGNGGSGQTINFVVKTRDYPGESLTTSNTSTCTSTTTKIDTRVRARQAVLRVESDDDAETEVRTGVGFRVGATRIDLISSGRR